MADVAPGEHWGTCSFGVTFFLFSKYCKEELQFGDLVERHKEWDKDEEEMLHSSLSMIK